MTTNETTERSVYSSHGEFRLGPEGSVIEFLREDRGDDLSTIKRFDLTEWVQFWGKPLQGRFDILDLGFWYVDATGAAGGYEPADTDYRNELATRLFVPAPERLERAQALGMLRQLRDGGLMFHLDEDPASFDQPGCSAVPTFNEEQCRWLRGLVGRLNVLFNAEAEDGRCKNAGAWHALGLSDADDGQADSPERPTARKIAEAPTCEFWLFRGTVFRCSLESPVDQNGLPISRRWECEKQHWDRYRNSVYHWASEVPRKQKPGLRV